MLYAWNKKLIFFENLLFSNISLFQKYHIFKFSSSQNEDDLDDDLDELEDGVDEDVMKLRRNQSTAVILLGVIGALFDLEADKKGEAELALGTHLTRLTAKALMFLVLTTSTSRAQSVIPMNAHDR